MDTSARSRPGVRYLYPRSAHHPVQPHSTDHKGLGFSDPVGRFQMKNLLAVGVGPGCFPIQAQAAQDAESSLWLSALCWVMSVMFDSSPVCDNMPALSCIRGPFANVRVGEASHPGPASTASAANISMFIEMLLVLVSQVLRLLPACGRSCASQALPRFESTNANCANCRAVWRLLRPHPCLLQCHQLPLPILLLLPGAWSSMTLRL